MHKVIKTGATLVAASLIAGAVAAPAQAAYIKINTVSNINSAAGEIAFTGAISGSDTIQFKSTGESFLQNNGGNPNQYGTNSAGVITTGSTNTGYPNTVGASTPDPVSGFTYGSLIAVLTSGSSIFTQQVFSTASGGGSPVPPSTFKFTGLVSSLFPTFTGSNNATLTFKVDDTGYNDNSGSFTVAAIPESATWAMMIIGFGAVGASMRRRRGIGPVMLGTS